MRIIIQALRLGVYTTLAALAVLVTESLAFADGPAGSATDQAAKFRQLGTELRAPNVFRNASGAPGFAYWQQRANYKIDVKLDEDRKQIIASETITYTNNSPDTLEYLWVQLDQNRFREDSIARRSETASTAGTRRDRTSKGDSISYNAMRRAQRFSDHEYGHQILSVTNAGGKPLPYVINDTMMRIDLPVPLKPEQTVSFGIDWKFNVIDEPAIGGRGGYEHFPETDTYIYFLAQWFPRMAAYTDYTGWQHKQFLGRGEFTLEFGDYEVNITVPADHIVSASGVLQNPGQVLTARQRQRLDEATATQQVFVVTPEEALKNEMSRARGTKTWRFKAENVRDFAFASSRKFIWDAMLHEQEDEDMPVVKAMSFYPNEAEPIWSKYSTQAVIHTMDVYSRFSFPYPYPVAQSVNTWERGGMEYPMITFNGYRPSKDEKSGDTTYSRNIKHALIGVIIHEIGHIYFPMTVNSDERQWTWMDEGLNTFLEYLAEYEWEDNFNILGNEANPLDVISTYMQSEGQVPIMTQSDSILQFGPNAYSKPASSLVVLRETVMGRELFDHAFKTYSQRWKFKRPTPADFFRTMEDASGVDLDWFFRGWYFGTDHVDIAIDDVREYRVSTQDPDTEFDRDRKEFWRDHPENITMLRNRKEGRKTRVEHIPGLQDLYDEKDKFAVSNKDRNDFRKFLEGLEDWERKVYDRAVEENPYLYFLDFSNIGGLVMPIPLHIEYINGETEKLMIPAEIWRRNSNTVTKLLIRDKQIKSINVDPKHQTADADYSNNSFPQKIHKSRLELYKSKFKARNLMQDMLVELKGEDKIDNGEAEDKTLPLEESGESINESFEKQKMETPAKQTDDKKESFINTPGKRISE